MLPHFDLGGERRRDYEGMEFIDADAALRNAIEIARTLYNEGLELGEDRSCWTCAITDEQAFEVAKLRLGDGLISGWEPLQPIPVQQ